jgi:hypothetical protein
MLKEECLRFGGGDWDLILKLVIRYYLFYYH